MRKKTNFSLQPAGKVAQFGFRKRSSNVCFLEVQFVMYSAITELLTSLDLTVMYGTAYKILLSTTQLDIKLNYYNPNTVSCGR